MELIRSLHIAVRRGTGLLLLLVMGWIQPLQAQKKFTSVQTGNWNAPATWTAVPAGGTPGSNDTVIISAGHTVTLTADASCNKIRVYGTLQVAGYSFSCGDSTIVLSGGLITDNNTGGSTTFMHLILSGGTLAGTVTDNFNVNSNLRITNSVSSTIGRVTLVVNGQTIIDAGSTLTINNINGGKTFVGKITNNGTWNSTVNENYTLRGSLENNGTFISGGGTYTFNTNNQTLGGTQPITFGGNVAIANGFTVTNQTYVIVNGVLNSGNNTSTWVNAANSTLRYNNTGTILMNNNGTLTATATGNTVIYGGSGNQNIRAVNYYNLALEGSGDKNLVGATNVTNDLSISAGANINLNNYTLTIAGNWDNVNTSNNIGSGTVIFNGTDTQSLKENSVFQNITKSNSGTLRLLNNISLYGTLTLQGGYIDGNGYTFSITNGSGGAVTRTGGWFYNGTFTRTLNGTSQDYLFPIGTSSYYRPLVLNFSSISGSTNVSLQFVAISPTGFAPYTDGVNLANLFDEGYWRLQCTGTPTGTYSLTLTGDGFSTYTIDNNCRISGRDAGNTTWRAMGAHGSVTGNTITRTGVTTLNNTWFDFAFASPCRVNRNLTVSDPSVCSSVSTQVIVSNSQTNVTYQLRLDADNSPVGSAVIGTGADILLPDLPITPMSSTIYNVLATDNITGCSYQLYDKANVTVYPYSGNIYSIASGNWNDPSVWSYTPGGPSCGLVPDASSNVYIESGHNITLNTNATVASVSIANGGALQLSTYNFTVSGNTQVNGTLSDNSATGNDIFVGLLSIGNTGQLDFSSGNPAVELRGGLQNNGVFNSGTGTWNFTTNNQTISGSQPIVFYGNVQIAAGITLTNQNTAGGSGLTFKATIDGVNPTSVLRNDGILTFEGSNAPMWPGTLDATTTAGNTVRYAATSPQTIRATSYYHLQLLGSGAKTFNSNIRVYGNLTISGATLTFGSVGAYTLELDGNLDASAGNIDMDNGTLNHVLILKGQNNSCANLLADDISRIEYRGGDNQQVFASSNYQVLVLGGTGTKQLMGNVSVNDTLRVETTVQVNGHDLYVNNPAGEVVRTGGSVVGTLKCAVGITGKVYNFPVGTVTEYHPLLVNFSDLTAGDLAVQYLAADIGNSGLPLNDNGNDIYEQFGQGYWQLIASSGLASTNYSLSLDANGFGIDEASRIIRRNDAGNLFVQGNHGSVAGNVISRTNFSGISSGTSDFGVGKGRPTIVLHPSDTTVCESTTAQFVCKATGHGTITYQWYKAPGSMLNDGGNISGATTDTLRISNVTNADEGQYYCIVTDGAGHTRQSNNATLTVDDLPVGGNVSPDTAICYNTNSGLLTLTGYSGNIIKWQYANDPYTVWTDIAHTANTYTSGNLTQDTRFRAVIGNGVCPDTYSGEAQVNIEVEKPIVTCPANQSVNTDVDECTYLHAGTSWDAIASDNCTVNQLSYRLEGATSGTGNTLNGVTFNYGVTTVWWRAIDNAGNADSCSFTVTVNDNQNPTLTAINDTIEHVDANCQFVLPDYRSKTVATDNCTPTINIVKTQRPAVGTLLSGHGTTQEVWVIADDLHGNKDSVSFTVILSDTIKPTLTPIADRTEYVDNACQFTIPDYTGFTTATDNCTPTINIVKTQRPAVGTLLSGHGTTQEVWVIADDLHGNKDSVSFTVTLSDTIRPTLITKNITVYLDVNSGAVSIGPSDVNDGSFDNCSLMLDSVVPNTFYCDNIGNNIVTLYASDGHGNYSSASAIVNVQYATPPLVTAVMADDTTCNGQQIDIHLLSNITATNFTWTVVAHPDLSGYSNGSAANDYHIKQNITNNGDSVRAIVYIIVPTIYNRCVLPTIYDTIYVNPTPRIIVAADDTLCNNGSTTFSITNPNTVRGVWRYDIDVTYPAGVSGSLNDQTNQTALTQVDNITNTTNDVQAVTYRFIPHIDPGDG
ncbi:MAG: immunoglobulin domain-containing protein, partial [Bacteroidales bacterium]